MKERALLIVSLAILTCSCRQAPSQQQSNMPKTEDQNFEQRRKDMQQNNSRCCEATEGAEKSSSSGETVAAPEVKIETKQ